MRTSCVGLQVFVVLLLASSTGLAGPPDPPAIQAETVFQAWKARQDRTRTFKYAWDQSMTYTKKTLPGKDFLQSPSLPAKDTTVRRRLSLSVDGRRMRHTNDGDAWISGEERFSSQSYVSVFDGRSSKSFYQHHASANADHPLGFVLANSKNPDVDLLNCRHLLIHYRPFHPEMGIGKPSEWRLTQHRGVVRGVECAILEKQAGSLRQSCWVDPKRDFAVLRYTTHVGQGLINQLEGSYEQDPEHGWVLSSWTITTFAQGVLLVLEHAENTATQRLINSPLDESAFQFSFPVGTIVEDSVERSRYLVREGDKKRIITLDESRRAPSYDVLVSTETGMAGLPTPSRFSRLLTWTLYLVAAVLAVSVVRVIVRRRKRVTG